MLYSHRELIEMDTTMQSAARSLDSEMQNLVYENYNKASGALTTPPTPQSLLLLASLPCN